MEREVQPFNAYNKSRVAACQELHLANIYIVETQELQLFEINKFNVYYTFKRAYNRTLMPDVSWWSKSYLPWVTTLRELRGLMTNVP